jgi:hypothetical protein
MARLLKAREIGSREMGRKAREIGSREVGR